MFEVKYQPTPGWQKMMFEFQRQHPIAALTRAFGLIRGNLVTILVFLVVGAQREEFPFLWWIGGGFLLLLIIGIAGWWRFLYRIEEGELQIKSGIFVRKNLFLTKDRIQVIDISSGVIQRIFGLVKVDIQTAGSTSRAASLEAVTKSKANEINRILRRNGSEKLEEFEQETDQNNRKIFSLPGKDLIIAASTSGRFGIALSILGTLFSQVEPLISDSEIFEFFFEMLPSQTDTFLVFSIIIVFVVVAWLISFFSTLLMYGDFNVEVKDDELVISRGIFEKKRITIPYKRIQAIYVNEGLLRQPLGYGSVHLESAGYGDDKGTGSIVLFPLISQAKISKLLHEILPSYDITINGYRPPVRAARRYIFRSAFLLTVVTAGLYWLLFSSNWIWLLPILSIGWGWLKYKDAAVAWNKDTLILRNRTLSKSTSIVKRDRIQDVSISESWIQRFRNLCTLQVYVASGDHGKSFVVQDMEREEVFELLKELQKNNYSLKTDGLINERPIPRVKIPAWPEQNPALSST
ncbi:MAG: PH domain-containing protein [Balneolaceae bacterium]